MNGRRAVGEDDVDGRRGGGVTDDEAALPGWNRGGVVLERRQRRRAGGVEVGEDGPVARGRHGQRGDGADDDIGRTGGADLDVGERLTGERRDVLHGPGFEAGHDDLAVDDDVDGGAGDAMHQRHGRRALCGDR